MVPHDAHPPLTDTFQRKLLRFSRSLIGALGALALVTGSALWFLVVPTLQSRLEQDTVYMAERLAETLVLAVAAEDRKLARDACASFVRDRDFGGVRVVLESGHVLYAEPPGFVDVDVPAGTDGPQWIGGRIASARRIAVEGTTLGTVVVAHSSGRIRILFGWFLGFGAMLLAFLGWAAWFAIRFDRRFVAPLRRVTDFARHLGGGDLGSRLDEPGATAEVRDLVDQMNRMASELERQQLALVSAREMAEAASEVKSRFLANMSHEMRTPLNGVIGVTEILLESKLEPRVREDLTVVHSSARGLIDIIEDVLDISKIEAGQVEVEWIALDVAEVVRAAVFSVVTQARKKGLRLVVDPDPEFPHTIVSDPTRIRQILLNLLSNAVKFTERGTVRLSLGWAGEQLAFRVEDEGIGMTEAQLGGVFEAFRQADASTTRRFGGTGLGLAISKNLAQLLGGDLHATSTVGEGSTFTLVLPAAAWAPPRPPAGRVFSAVGPPAWAAEMERRVRAFGASWGPPDEATDLLVGGELRPMLAEIQARLADLRRSSLRLVGLSQPDRLGDDNPLLELGVEKVLIEPVFAMELFVGEPSDGPARREDPKLDGLRVLVAEDNPVNQKVVVRALEKLGVQATLAENGERAVALVLGSEPRFDVVLMDLQMPVMDGFEATRRIREQDQTTPIIALTADAMSDAWGRCLDAGMTDFLTKPLKRALLAEKLARARLGDAAA